MRRLPPPPTLDWKVLYQERMELERRWIRKASEETANEPSVNQGSVSCLKFDANWDDAETPGFMVSGSSDCSVRV